MSESKTSVSKVIPAIDDALLAVALDRAAKTIKPKDHALTGGVVYTIDATVRITGDIEVAEKTWTKNSGVKPNDMVASLLLGMNHDKRERAISDGVKRIAKASAGDEVWRKDLKDIAQIAKGSIERCAIRDGLAYESERAGAVRGKPTVEVVENHQEAMAVA